MYKQRRKNTNNKSSIKNLKIVRCKNRMVPVFESDNCKEFIKREGAESNSICKNCKNSF